MALFDSLAPYYDLVYAAKDYDGESSRLHALIERHVAPPARTLLDVACGTGSHLARLRTWYDVAGVDVNRSMLAVARRKLGADVPLRIGDMRSFRWDAEFDVLTCLFSAWGYLRTRADRDRAAANFYRHLAPGGVAFVEGWLFPERWRADRATHLLTVDRPEAKIARATRSRRRGRWSEMEMEYLVVAPDRPIRRFRETHRMPLVPLEENIASFRSAGFCATVLRRGPYADRGLYVARRPPVRTSSR